MKNILIVDGRKTIGGGQVITKAICESLSLTNNISVFIPEGNTPVSNYLRAYKQHGYKFHEYSRGKKKIKDYFYFVINFFYISISLNKVLNKNKIDIIYIQSQNILPIVTLINLIYKKTIVSHLHVVHIDCMSLKLLNLCLANKYVKRIIGVSNFTLNQLTPNNKKKSIVLYNPTSINDKIIKPSLSYQIAVVGDIIENKGQRILFDAIQYSQNKYTIHVIGKIVDEILYHELINKYKDKVNYVFTGMISNVSEYLTVNNIDLVIIPSSSTETFSLSMVEAWSKGIPTVATNDYGMKELVNTLIPNYANDMLFTLKDAKELYDKIEKLETNRNLYTTISNDVYNTVLNHFSKDIFSTKLNNILKDL